MKLEEELADFMLRQEPELSGADYYELYAYRIVAWLKEKGMLKP